MTSPTRANGQPAFGAYLRASTGIRHGSGLFVLSLTGDRICAFTRFDGSVLPWFGLPRSLRFCLARDAQLLSEVLGLFVRALFVFQRRTARRLGVSRPLPGAVAFVQRFGSALQLTPHFHVLVPEAVFEEVDEAELRLHPLPRPTDREVETLAVTVARRVLRLLHARGVLAEESAADGALDLLQLEGVQVPRQVSWPAVVSLITPLHPTGTGAGWASGG